jgi:hypothetical protein
VSCIDKVSDQRYALGGGAGGVLCYGKNTGQRADEAGQVEIIEETLDKLSQRVDRLESMVDQGSGACPCGC